MEWRPCIIKNKASGQSVHVTIFDRELYLSGFWSFEELIEIYGDDNKAFVTPEESAGK